MTFSDLDFLADFPFILMNLLLPAVRGMMYYRRALKLQAFLDMASETGIKSLPLVLQKCKSCSLKLICFSLYTGQEILEGYKAVTGPADEESKSQRSLSAQLEAVADMKFTYVATCQIYGNQKQSGDRRATDILNLMVKYVLTLHIH